jgi:FixJ family two-component response regulator
MRSVASRLLLGRAGEERRTAGADPIVYVVDDDTEVREATADVLAAEGLRVQTFSSAEAYLARATADVAACCLLLDVCLPGLSGLELQRELNARSGGVPIVFMSGHGDVPMSVQALRAGAVTFLQKPFDPRALLEAVHEALTRDRRVRAERAWRDDLARRLALLSPREREVMTGVVAGNSNKEIARHLGISEITVKLHRGRVMKKMRADTLADLVRLYVDLDAEEHVQA